MKSRSALFVLAAFVVISVCSYAGWRYIQEREDHICGACQRPIHENSRTVAVVNGKRIGYCCPACAFSQQRQTGKVVQIVSLSDFRTGEHLDPDTAFLVRGSDVNTCAGHGATPGPDKQPMESHFDRCSPGLLAFRDRPDAEAFVREHGGEITRVSTVAGLYR